MQITIFVQNSEDQMKVNNRTKPADVCLFFIKKHKLDANISWALFEVINEGLFGKPQYILVNTHFFYYKKCS